MSQPDSAATLDARPLSKFPYVLGMPWLCWMSPGHYSSSECCTHQSLTPMLSGLRLRTTIFISFRIPNCSGGR